MIIASTIALGAYLLGVAHFIRSMVAGGGIVWRAKPASLDYLLCAIWPITLVIALMGPQKGA